MSLTSLRRFDTLSSLVFQVCCSFELADLSLLLLLFSSITLVTVAAVFLPENPAASGCPGAGSQKVDCLSQDYAVTAAAHTSQCCCKAF